MKLNDEIELFYVQQNDRKVLYWWWVKGKTFKCCRNIRLLESHFCWHNLP